MNMPAPKCSSQIFLAVLIMVGFFGAIFLLATHETPAKGGEALLTLLGVLAGGWKDTVGYFFGSSTGSRAKEEIIASSMNAKSTPAPVTQVTQVTQTPDPVKGTT